MAEAVTDRSDKAKRPTNAASADSLRLPILDLEAVDASKLAQICADENQAARERLTGDQDIVGADRRADMRQCGSHPTGCARVVSFEFKDLKSQVLIQQGDVVLDTPTLECTKIQFVQYDGRDAYAVGLVSSQPFGKHRL